MTTMVDGVRFEHHREPLGIGESRPRVSWKVQTDQKGWQQQAYEIAIRPAGGQDGSEESSGKVDSAESVLVPWPFDPLPSRARRTVRVRV
jgi:alpha-L-rhamnosidase